MFSKYRRCSQCKQQSINSDRHAWHFKTRNVRQSNSWHAIKSKNVKLLPMANISPSDVSQDRSEEISGRGGKKDSLCLADSLRERNSKSWANIWLCIVAKVFVSLTQGDFNAICIFVYKYFSRCLGCSIKRMHWNVSPYTGSAMADTRREPMRSRLHVTCFPKNRSLLPLQSSLSDFSLPSMGKPGEGWLNGCS